MGWRDRLAPPDRPAPGQLAILASVAVLLLAPFALIVTWVDSAVSSATMAVPTTVVLGGYLDDVPTLETSDGRLAAAPNGVAVEVADRSAVSLYCRTETLVAIGIGLVIVVAAIIAVAVLLRRPVSRAVAVSFMLLAVYFGYASIAAPIAAEAGERRIIELLDLPTTDAPSSSAGFAVEPGLTDWHAWHAIFWILAAVSLAAAFWVLHVRRQLQLSRAQSSPALRDVVDASVS